MTVSKGEDNLAKDFKSERLEASEAVKLARVKSQLKKLDPEAFEMFYGDSMGSGKRGSPGQLLIEVEALRMLRQMRLQDGTSGAQTGSNPETKELRDEVKALKKQLEDQKYQALKSEIQGLREAMERQAGNTSEFGQVISAAEKTASKFMDKVNLLDMGMSLMGFQKLPMDVPQGLNAQQVKDARNPVIEGLREKGFVTRVLQR